MILFMMTANGKRVNKNFEAALAYVQANYAEMFHPSLRSVQLVSPDGRAWGRFWSFTVRRDPATGKLSKVEQSIITIADVRQPVQEFIDTLVHELTRLQQHLAGRAYSELEAQSAGPSSLSPLVPQLTREYGLG